MFKIFTIETYKVANNHSLLIYHVQTLLHCFRLRTTCRSWFSPVFELALEYLRTERPCTMSHEGYEEKAAVCC